MGGGYYAGSISTTGNGVATHYLIVAPKASGEASNKPWITSGAVTTARTSLIDGPTNSAALAALGAAYQAATFCEGLTIGGYSDWYLPARNELEVLYYFLKPTADGNSTGHGGNANAVSPEPISTNYTSSLPAQTSAGIGFRAGETNALAVDAYWSCSEINNGGAHDQYMGTGYQGWTTSKLAGHYVRAVRRIPIV